MSLIGALNIGKSALAVSQAQIQTTGNNIANANTPGYTRQVAGQTAAPVQQIQTGSFVGTGVDLTGIKRQIDQALEGRLNSATSDSQSADTTQQWLSRVESVFDALGTGDLSSKMSTFFNSWSSLANKPQDAGLRQIVLQNGDDVAKTFQTLRGQLVNLQGDAASQLKALAGQADGLAQQIADYNAQIVVAEGGSGGTANTLRDNRDAAIKQLSQLVDVHTIEQPNGAVNVYVGSEPLVMNAQNRGVTVKQTTTNGLIGYSPVFKMGGGTMDVKSGQLASLAAVQQTVGNSVDHVDSLAKGLIFELNKVHASGQGLDGITSATAANGVTDATVPLNDPKSGLKFPPNNGSFVVHVTQKATGLVTSTLVQVDLNGQAGDTTLNSLKASLAGINGLNASIAGGKLSIAAASPNVSISFSQDTSGALASLGVNNFYTGSNARDIAVSQALKDQPNLLAAAKNGAPGDNQTALAIAGLESQSMAVLKGSNLKDSYQSIVNGISTSTAAAKTNAEASKGVTDALQAQRDALSGVSVDEEAINLLRQQRAYQGAARLISAVDEMMKTLLAIT
jgi:flagellar hook-associated protein 1 FlgK